MTTILNNSEALQHFETFSTPWREGGGALKQQRKVNGMHRVHNLQFVFFCAIYKVLNMQLSRALASGFSFYSNVDAVEHGEEKMSRKATILK